MDPTSENPLQELVSFYDELPFWSAPFGIELLKHIRFRKFIQVLDIGSGAGFPLLEVAQRLGETCRVFGIDPWEEAVERIRQKIGFYGIRNAEIMAGKAEELLFENGTFSLIISNNGLNNVENLDLVMEECHRVARPGAQLLFTINLPGTMTEFYEVFGKVIKEFPVERETADWKETSIRKMKDHIQEKRKSVVEMVDIVENHGFKTESIHESAFTYSFSDGSALLHYSFFRRAFLPSWKELVPEPHRNDVMVAVEKELNEMAAVSGKLELTIPFASVDCTLYT